MDAVSIKTSAMLTLVPFGTNSKRMRPVPLVKRVSTLFTPLVMLGLVSALTPVDVTSMTANAAESDSAQTNIESTSGVFVGTSTLKPYPPFVPVMLSW